MHETHSVLFPNFESEVHAFSPFLLHVFSDGNGREKNEHGDVWELRASSGTGGMGWGVKGRRAGGGEGGGRVLE